MMSILFPQTASAVKREEDSNGDAVSDRAEKESTRSKDRDNANLNRVENHDKDEQLVETARERACQVIREAHETKRSTFHRLFLKHQPPKPVAWALCVVALPVLLVVGLVLLLCRLLMRIEALAKFFSDIIPVAMHETFHVFPDLESITLQEFLMRHGTDKANDEAKGTACCSAAPLGAKPVETANLNWAYPWQPDVRMYWFGLGRVCGAGPECEYFDASKPTIIYVHGWQPGVTERGFRETINWVNPPGTTSSLPDTQVVDLWVARGYNVGVFYWNQLADEPTVSEAERKIYNATDGTRLRWRRRNADGSTMFVDHAGLFDTDHCVADMLVKSYLAHFPPRSTAHYGAVHFLGHSLGAQLTLEFLRRLLLGQTSYYGTAKASPICYPERLTLVDPFFTSDCKSYGPLDGLRPSQRATENLHLVREALPKLLVETYETSLIGAGALGDSCPRLKRHSVYHVVDIEQIPWTDVSLRHCAAPFVYFCSILRKDAEQWRPNLFNAAVTYADLLDKMPPHATHEGPLHDHLRPGQALLASASLLVAPQ
ncbi:Hypothetical Protein FCC1311_105452 [Hondaea fermentalgiana]|uniref:Uncharacterized protein n=1 Tax=Hondaea fermentalgiana TaxID=2315210 RepID=A0A2R5GTY2_9STRA|nr:Hypothetical Protein FCC1311_105452 [Hondaea fermentalgiana]|eukprot:GBG34322.1 Hypothetical Protein FCC1311_105452 [Hondaea fermentalgiana]